MGDTHEYDSLERLLEADYEHAVAALDSRVAAHGDKIAVTVGETGERLSYAEIGRLTDAFAVSLLARGVGRGDRVAVVSDAPLTSIITMFGAWKIGAVFSPINPEYSGDYLTYHLNDCGARLVVASPETADRIQEVRKTIIEHFDLVIDEELTSESPTGSVSLSDLVANDGTGRPACELAFDDPASIIYTSGTTGPAKGVIQSHRWINQYSWQYRRWTDSSDVIHVDLPMYHVGAAFFNVVRALWVGASVSVWKRFSASQYWQRIADSGATCALLFDVMIPWLLQQPASPGDAHNTLRHVHMQPLPANHREFAERFGVDWVTAGFGQTESGSAIYGLIDEFPDDDGPTPPALQRGMSKTIMRANTEETGALLVDGNTITTRGFMGRPTPFLEIEIHDDKGRQCQRGDVGELVVRPRIPSVMFSMYLDKPNYSLHAFRNLWFHTGDAAVQNDDGVFFYSGRLGERIRVKGENVSALDIEQQALQHEFVQKAAAIGVPHTQGEEDQIVLFVELDRPRSAMPVELAEFLRGRLPKAMVPHRIHVIEHMPVTQTNKIQKHKLRSLAEGNARG